MRFVHPCKNCLVQPMCKIPCHKYSHYNRTYTQNFPVVFWITTAVASILMFMVGEGWVAITFPIFLMMMLIQIISVRTVIDRIKKDYDKRFERRNVYGFG